MQIGVRTRKVCQSEGLLPLCFRSVVCIQHTAQHQESVVGDKAAQRP